MVRTIVVIGFILGLISAAILGSNWLQSGDKQPVTANQPTCDLLAGPCEWETNSGPWRVRLAVTDGQTQGAQYQLAVHAPVSPQRLLAVLRGESMYMGEYPVPLKREDKGKYSAHFAAPLCATGSEMVWRVDLQSGQQPLAETAPLKLIFQAGEH